ncbi:MAG: hypothetical protein ACWGO1_05735 [Anaerolineales bacterium]
MIGVLAVAFLTILYIYLSTRKNKFKEIERQQAMRRAMIELREKSQRYSL